MTKTEACRRVALATLVAGAMAAAPAVQAKITVNGANLNGASLNGMEVQGSGSDDIALDLAVDRGPRVDYRAAPPADPSLLRLRAIRLRGG